MQYLSPKTRTITLFLKQISWENALNLAGLTSACLEAVILQSDHYMLTHVKYCILSPMRLPWIFTSIVKGVYLVMSAAFLHECAYAQT